MFTFLRTMAALSFTGCIGLMGVAAPAALADSPWTSAGSAGTVDEADLTLVSLSGPYASVVPAAAAGTTVDIRYNVVAVEGLHGWDGYQLKVRYLDNGAGARVIVRLKEYNINNGNTYTRMTFDSDTFAASPAYQTRSIDSGCWPGWAFNFGTSIFYLEVELQKTGAGGGSGISALQISGILC